MTNKEILEKRNFVVVGDTINKEKYAYRIKEALIANGYNVECVGKELKALDDVDRDIDIVDLCINPTKGLEILQSTNKDIPFVLIQPGAGSDEIESYLNSSRIEFKNGCILKALEERE